MKLINHFTYIVINKKRKIIKMMRIVKLKNRKTQLYPGNKMNNKKLK